MLGEGLLVLSIEKIRDAAEDLIYLLDRGYRKESSVNFIASRYSLDSRARSILYRAVTSRKEAKETFRKSVRWDSIKGEATVVDGYNVLNTLDALERGDILVKCVDGVIRDVSEVHGKFRVTDRTLALVKNIVSELYSLGSSNIVVVYDAQISRSGELASATRKIIYSLRLKGDAKAVKSADRAIIMERCIAVTSDSALISKLGRFFDLPAYMVNLLVSKGKKVNLLDLSYLANMDLSLPGKGFDTMHFLTISS